MSRKTVIEEYKAIFSDSSLTPEEQNSKAYQKFCDEEKGFSPANQLSLLAQIEKVADRNFDDIRLWIKLQ